MTKKQNDIKRQLVVSIFWCIVALGLISSNSVHGFWRVVCCFWLISQIVSLYINIRNYGEEGRKTEQERQRKSKSTQEQYDRIFNDFAKRIYEQQYQHRQTMTVKPEMSITDAYKLMKLKYTDTPSEIKKRYRELAMLWHPDKFATESKSKQETANRNFQKLNTAYNVIKKHKKIV